MAAIISAAYADSSEVRRVKKAARALGMTPSAFIRRLSLRYAARVIKLMAIRRGH